MNQLPQEILFHIFSFLNSKEKREAALVSLQWRQLLDDNTQWSSLLKKDFNYECDPNESAKLIYKKFSIVQDLFTKSSVKSVFSYKWQSQFADLDIEGFINFHVKRIRLTNELSNELQKNLNTIFSLAKEEYAFARYLIQIFPENNNLKAIMYTIHKDKIKTLDLSKCRIFKDQYDEMLQFYGVRFEGASLDSLILPVLSTENFWYFLKQASLVATLSNLTVCIKENEQLTQDSIKQIENFFFKNINVVSVSLSYPNKVEYLYLRENSNKIDEHPSKRKKSV